MHCPSDFRMSLSPPSLDALCKSMNSYAGRDKIVRSLAFMSALQAFSSQPSKEWAVSTIHLSIDSQFRTHSLGLSHSIALLHQHE